MFGIIHKFIVALLGKFKNKNTMANNEQYPRFIPDKPTGDDVFEGQSQTNLANNICEYIRSNDSASSRGREQMPRIIGLEGKWGSGKSNVVELTEDDYNFAEQGGTFFNIITAIAHKTGNPSGWTSNLVKTQSWQILSQIPSDFWLELMSRYQHSYFSKSLYTIDEESFIKEMNEFLELANNPPIDPDYKLGEDLSVVIDEVFNLFFVKIISILIKTYKRYLTLINLYESNKDNLLNQLKRVQDDSTIRNDTPVLNYESQDLSSNQYASDIVKHQHSSQYDVDTIMGRIDEINRKYRNLISDWVDEFKGIFWEVYENE